jgi:hypothetical protein
MDKKRRELWIIEILLSVVIIVFGTIIGCNVKNETEINRNELMMLLCALVGQVFIESKKLKLNNAQFFVIAVLEAGILAICIAFFG